MASCTSAIACALPSEPAKHSWITDLSAATAWHYNVQRSSHNAPTACNRWQQHRTFTNIQPLARHTTSQERSSSSPRKLWQREVRGAKRSAPAREPAKGVQVCAGRAALTAAL